MQRVRTSLPYYKEMGWEPVVICVNEKYAEGFRDELLGETIPADIEIHRINALPARFTRKFGLGSLSMRSYFHFKRKGSELLRNRKFDLVFFSTTMFHVIALGRYWKEKFGVPFVVDMQDPWRNDFYVDKPKHIRPPKYRIAYNIDKRMEAYTMPHAAGIISVSQGYIDELRARYPVLQRVPATVIPFGVSEIDFELVRKKQIPPEIINRKNEKINVVYVGAVTQFFIPLIRAFFLAFKKMGTDTNAYHFYFIGTNYSINGKVKTIEKLAQELDISNLVTEVPGRIPYFSALATLMHADILFIPGSQDADYNASKVYNNVFAGKPVFTMFNEKSLVINIIKEANAGIAVGLNQDDTEQSIILKLDKVMKQFIELHKRTYPSNKSKLEQFTTHKLTEMQTNFFSTLVP
jgi:glycosyltransferase involved in cell wall biosynthesis